MNKLNIGIVGAGIGGLSAAIALRQFGHKTTIFEKTKTFVDGYDAFLDEMESLIVGNEILLARTQNIGQVSKELMINAGITGPMLRAAGVPYDIRKVDSYGIYDRFDFKVPYGEKETAMIA